MNKFSFNSNTIEIEDAIFTQSCPSDAVKYEDSIGTLINYVQKYNSAGVYLGQ